MKRNSNLVIILVALAITAAVYLLFLAGEMDPGNYLGIAAIAGGVIALYMGYRFLMAYMGKGKHAPIPVKYAELRPFEKEYARGEINLFFELPEEDSVSFSLVDMSGKVVKTLKEGPVLAGGCPVSLETRDLPNGTYFYELVTSNYRNSKKLIIYNV